MLHSINLLNFNKNYSIWTFYYTNLYFTRFSDYLLSYYENEVILGLVKVLVELDRSLNALQVRSIFFNFDSIYLIS